MKTFFETDPCTGKISLHLEAENDNERNLMNRLMSRTMEERMTNNRLRIERKHPSTGTSVMAVISKPTYLNSNILTAMGFERDESILERKAPLFFNAHAQCLVELSGTHRAWFPVKSFHSTEKNELVIIPFESKTLRRYYIQTVDQLEQIIRGRMTLPRERE